MIKINLLNSFKEVSRSGGIGGVIYSDDEEKGKVYRAVGLRILVLLFGPLGLYIYEVQTLPVLQASLNELNQKYNDMKQFNDSKQGMAEEIKKYEIEQARFNAQMDFINKIDRDKVNEYKLFEHLKTSTPDNVWINKLELQDNSLRIDAESYDAKEIEKFIQRLSNSDFIADVIPLNQTSKKGFAGTDVSTTVFSVKAQLISPGLQ